MTSPLRYIGSKFKLAPFILSLMPKHNAYVEVFGGSAQMLFRKDPKISKLEVYNDVDEYLPAFFRTLREQPEALQAACQLTPYSRDEHRYCRDTYKDEGLSDLERARRVYVTYRQSFGGKVAASWGFSTEKYNAPRSFRNHSDHLIRAADRLRDVQIENGDFGKIIKQYGHVPGNLLYGDPPYLPSTRNSACDACYCGNGVVCPRCAIYRCEMGVNEHIRFLEAITASPAMAMISGYESDMYDDYLYGWRRYSKIVAVSSSNVRLEDGRLNRAKEIVWINPAAEIAFATGIILTSPVYG